MIEWLRRRLGPSEEVLAAYGEYEHTVLDLEVKVEQQADLLRRADQRNADLRKRNAELRDLIRAAYEPTEVGECSKVRYTRESDAYAHAVELAMKHWDQGFNAYQCRRCPPYRLTGEGPWHAGSCRADDPNAVSGRSQTLQYGCGCVFDTGRQNWLWRCVEHPAESA